LPPKNSNGQSFIGKKLPKAVKLKAEKQEEIFLANPFDSRLDTHKLQMVGTGVL
jgi:hypothetical protein